MKLGDRVKSKITGIEGIVTGTVRHLTGCDQAIVQPPYNNEKGSIPDSHWVDVMAVEVLQEKAVQIPHLSDVEPAG